MNRVNSHFYRFTVALTLGCIERHGESSQPRHLARLAARLAAYPQHICRGERSAGPIEGSGFGWVGRQGWLLDAWAPCKSGMWASGEGILHGQGASPPTAVQLTVERATSAILCGGLGGEAASGSDA